MKASYYEGKGNMSVGEAEAVRPGPGEVRVEIAYCGICGTGMHVFKGSMDQRVDLHKFFWREYQMRGARVYEKEDFEQGLSLISADASLCRRIVTGSCPPLRYTERL